jgi:hypothetical protein
VADQARIRKRRPVGDVDRRSRYRRVL